MSDIIDQSGAAVGPFTPERFERQCQRVRFVLSKRAQDRAGLRPDLKREITADLLAGLTASDFQDLFIEP